MYYNQNIIVNYDIYIDIIKYLMLILNVISTSIYIMM